jgi:hypothetical protein
MRPGDRARHLLATGFLIALSVVSVLAGFVFTAAGHPIALLYCGLFALILVLAVIFGRSLRVGGRSDLASAIGAVAGEGGTSTRISPSSTQFVQLVVLMASCAAFCLLAAVGITTHGRGGSVLVTSIVAGAIGVFCASFVVAAALGRVRRGWLTLSASGIVQRGWSFENRLAWSDVAGIEPAFNGHPVILLIGYANAAWERRYTARMLAFDAHVRAVIAELAQL